MLRSVPIYLHGHESETLSKIRPIVLFWGYSLGFCKIGCHVIVVFHVTTGTMFEYPKWMCGAWFALLAFSKTNELLLLESNWCMASLKRCMTKNFIPHLCNHISRWECVSILVLEQCDSPIWSSSLMVISHSDAIYKGSSVECRRGGAPNTSWIIPNQNVNGFTLILHYTQVMVDHQVQIYRNLLFVDSLLMQLLLCSAWTIHVHQAYPVFTA